MRFFGTNMNICRNKYRDAEKIHDYYKGLFESSLRQLKLYYSYLVRTDFSEKQIRIVRLYRKPEIRRFQAFFRL